MRSALLRGLRIRLRRVFCSAGGGFFFASDAAINCGPYVQFYDLFIGPDAYHGAVIAPLLLRSIGFVRTQYIAFRRGL